MARQTLNVKNGDGLSGERIRRLRSSLGYSQAEVVRQVGSITQRTLVRWESGHEPRLGSGLRDLASFLRVKPGFILYGEED